MEEGAEERCGGRGEKRGGGRGGEKSGGEHLKGGGKANYRSQMW